MGDTLSGLIGLVVVSLVAEERNSVFASAQILGQHTEDVSVADLDHLQKYGLVTFSGVQVQDLLEPSTLNANTLPYTILTDIRHSKFKNWSEMHSSPCFFAKLLRFVSKELETRSAVACAACVGSKFSCTKKNACLTCLGCGSIFECYIQVHNTMEAPASLQSRRNSW